MPAPNWTADNITEVAILGHWSNGRPVVNVLHYWREEDDAPTAARELLNAWQDDMMDEIPNNYVLDGCRYRDRNEAAGVVGTLGPNSAKALTGGATGACTSPNVAILVHKNATLHAGQRSGRIYLPGAPDAEIDEDGNLSATLKTAWNTALASFYSKVDGGTPGNELHIVHFTGPDDDTGTSTFVTGLTLDPKVATMRRRLRK